jgi:hypothetical protein
MTATIFAFVLGSISLEATAPHTKAAPRSEREVFLAERSLRVSVDHQQVTATHPSYRGGDFPQQ